VNFWSKLQSIDVRIIYITVFVTLAIPLLIPLGIPLTVADNSVNMYTLIEDLQPGDRVLMSLDYTALVAPEVHAGTVAICRHLFEKGVGVAMFGYIPEGPMFGDMAINQLADEYDLVYGKDVVNLGFIPGSESGVRAFGDNILESAPRCFRNQVTKDMPIMQGVRNAADFKMLIGIGDGLQVMVQQIHTVHGTPICGVSTAAGTTGLWPYVNSGQIKAMLSGLRGCAEYEMLVNKPSTAVAKMDGQSLGHLVIILFIAAGNIGHFVTKKNKSEAKQ
jgi:hypothetical protein